MKSFIFLCIGLLGIILTIFCELFLIFDIFFSNVNFLQIVSYQTAIVVIFCISIVNVTFRKL